MFTIKEYLSNPYVPELYPVKVREDEFLIRRMNGVESVKIETLAGEQRVEFVLGDCVYDGFTKRPLGPIHAEEFLKQYGGLAIDVYLKILTDTTEYEKAERAALDTEIKNSGKTDSPSSTGSTASGSDSIPNEQKSAKNS